MARLQCAGAIIAALTTRLVFTIHCLVALYRIGITIDWNPWYWFLLAGLVGLLIETVITLYVRKGAEYKW